MTAAASATYRLLVSPQLDRVRRFLLSRYGVDASTLGESETIRRAAAILGISRTDSAAGMLASINLRLDGEWNEEDHPRAEDGKFSGEGGGAATSKAETGSSGDHATRAAESARQARAVASGTTPSARASARKAEESAAAARVAHERGDHTAAARHASEAARHAADVDRKVAAHVPASERGLEAKQMRQEATGVGDGGSTKGERKLSRLASEASKTARQAAESGSAAQASKAYQLAATAHNLAATEARASGDTASANRHAAEAAEHLRIAGQWDRERIGRQSTSKSRSTPAEKAQANGGGKTRDIEGAAPSSDKRVEHPRIAAANQLSNRAYQATERANAKDTPEAHREAARLHGQALTEQRATGGTREMREHGRMMDDHEARAAKLEGKSPAVAATDRAFKASETAYTKERHLEAEQLHREASNAQSRAGNAGAARAHEEAADSHKIAAALEGSGSRRTTSADRSGSAIAVAKEFAAEAKHLSDNPGTDRKSDVSGNLVHHSSVDDYEHSGDTEHHADRLKSMGAKIVDTRDQYFSEDHGRGDVFYKLPKGVSASQFRQVDYANHDVHSSWSVSKSAKEHLDRAVTAVQTGRGEDAVRHAAEASRLGREHAETMRRR